MGDNFFEEENEHQPTNKQRFYRLLAYVPVVNIILFFWGQVNSEREEKRYFLQWITLFALYVVMAILFSFITWIFVFLIGMIYFGIVCFFWWKAYNGEYIEIQFLQNIISKFDPTQPTSKKQDKNDPLG